ncbi:MAG: energy coupling factor transporter S component ThiW [Nitrososphaerota archaeon]
MKTREVATVAFLTALGIAISPLSFEWLGTKAFPGQHLINVLVATLLGPHWAALIAFFIGTIRMAVGTGTIFAYPGGIPGGVVVGIVYIATSRLRSAQKAYLACLAEPVGTVLIGGTLSLLVVAPLVGPGVGPSAAMLSSLETLGPVAALLALWGGWLVSSVTGSLIGYTLLTAAERSGLVQRRAASVIGRSG